MLVLSKLTNINHANGGSYDPPLFLYSALFAARGRFGGASPHGGGVWRGFPARRRLWRGFPARRRSLAGLPRTAAALAGFPARRRALVGCPARRRALAGFPARLSLPPRYIRLGSGSFFAVFRIRARHTAKASAKISPVTFPYFILHRKIQEVC